jgi:HEAT repeat protein
LDQQNRLAVLNTVYELDPSGEYALPVCIKALGDADPAIRKEALVGAVRYRSRLATFKEHFIESLKDPVEENRLLAIAIVKGFGNKAVEAIPNLIALCKEGTPKVRISALSCLGVFSPPSAEMIGVLEEALQDKDEKVKMAALSSLRTLGQSNPEAVILILEKALDAEREQRTKRSIVAALDALKKTGQGAPNR